MQNLDNSVMSKTNSVRILAFPLFSKAILFIVCGGILFGGIYDWLNHSSRYDILDLPGIFLMIFCIYWLFIINVAVKFENGNLYIWQLAGWKLISRNKIEKINLGKVLEIHTKKRLYWNIQKVFWVSCLDTTNTEWFISFVNSAIEQEKSYEQKILKPGGQPSLVQKSSKQMPKPAAQMINVRIVGFPMLFKLGFILFCIFILYLIIRNLDLYHERPLFSAIALLLFMNIIYSLLITVVAVKYENNKLFIKQFFSWKQIDIKLIKEINAKGNHFTLNTIKYYNIFRRFGIPYPGSSGELLAKTLKADHGIKLQ
jgi:hypothetical protein